MIENYEVVSNDWNVDYDSKWEIMLTYSMIIKGFSLCLTASQNHRCWKDLWRSFSPRVPWIRLQRKALRWVLNIFREGDSPASLDSFLQCLVSLKVRMFSLMIVRNCLCSSLSPLPLFLLLGTVENSLTPFT